MLRNGRPSIIIQSIAIESAPPALGRGGVPYLLVNVMQIKPIMILSAALTVAASGTAFAHAELQSSAPQKNAVLNSPPSEVAIDFSEEVNPKLSRIVVKNAAGERVDKNDGHVAADNAKHFSVDLGPLAAGEYEVSWTSVAAEDGHKLSGKFKFKVAP
jgi:methionine-rich copper-binding protein CopC